MNETKQLRLARILAWYMCHAAFGDWVSQGRRQSDIRTYWRAQDPQVKKAFRTMAGNILAELEDS
jgi:hypothetical protein